MANNRFEKFYVKTNAPRFKQTAVPTGVLRSPLDLVTMSRPWLTVANTVDDELSEKKTIIFADHLFQYRDISELRNISKAMKELHESGFTIYILSSTDELQPWDGMDIRTDYHLSLAKYTDEYIKTLAWKQHALIEKKVFILDYFGMNDLLEHNRYRINTNILRYDRNAFFNLIGSCPGHNLQIYFSDKIDAKLLFSLKSDKFKMFANRISSIDITQIDIKKLNFDLLLDNFPNLDEINYFGGGSIDEMKLPDAIMIKLGGVRFSGTIQIIDFIKFILRAPNLHWITIDGYIDPREENELDKYLVPNCLPKLTRFENSKGVPTLFKGYIFILAPNLKSLSFTNVYESMNKININPAAMGNLQSLTLQNDHEHTIPSELFNAPNLSDINYKGHPNVIPFLEKLPAHVLKNIKTLHFEWLDRSIGSLLNRLVNLQELIIDECNGDKAFVGFTANSLPALKKLTITYRYSLGKEFFQLLYSANRLEKLFILANVITKASIQPLPAFKFPCLNSLTMGFGDEILSQTILSAAPNLQQVYIDIPFESYSFNFLSGNNLPMIDVLNSEKSQIRNNSEKLRILDSCQTFTKLALCNALILNKTIHNVKELMLGRVRTSISSLLHALELNPQITTLDLETTSINEESIHSIKSSSGLKRLTIWNSTISYEIFEALLEHAQALEVLELWDSSTMLLPKLKPNSLRSLLQLKVKIDHFVQPTPTLLEGIFKAAPFLQVLVIQSGSSIEFDKSSLTTPNLTMNLKKIDLLSDARFMSNFDLAQLQQMAPNAVIVGHIDTTQNTNIVSHLGLKDDPKIGDNRYLDPGLARPGRLGYVEYFPGVDASFYRLAISKPDLNTLTISSNTKASDFKDIKLSNHDFLQDPEAICKKGFITVDVMSTNNIILPSLDAEEHVFKLNVYDKSGNLVPKSEYQIQHSNSSRFFRVVLKNRGDYSIVFYVAVYPKPDLSHRLTDILKKYLSFASYSSQRSEKIFTNLKEAAAHINETRAGVCRHRAIAAYAELIDEYDDRVRIVSNDIHMFIEAKEKGVWYELDLGGSEDDHIKKNKQKNFNCSQDTKEEMQSQSLQRLLPSEETSLQFRSHSSYSSSSSRTTRTTSAQATGSGISSASASILSVPATAASYLGLALGFVALGVMSIPFAIPYAISRIGESSATIEEIKDDNANLTEPPEDKVEVISEALLSNEALLVSEPGVVEESSTRLCITTSDSSLSDYYTTLREQFGQKNIFVAHQPEDISLLGYGMTAAGEIRPSYTPLQNWLNKRKHGVVIIDMRSFDDSEVAQLNDFIDHHLEDHIIPKDITIQLIDLPGRIYGPDFLRRVHPDHLLLTDLNQELLPPAAEASAVTIDLFNSFYWQSSLLGYWQLLKKTHDKDMSFKWQPGNLLNLILAESALPVIFKNPPLNDPAFTAFVAELQGLRRVTWADQSQAIPDTITFTQQSGYDWEVLANSASLQTIDEEHLNNIFVLHDSNVLSFVQDISYEFSPGANLLEPKRGYLNRGLNGLINVVCAPGLSPGALAQVLTAAKSKNCRINFVIPSDASLSAASALHYLRLKSSTPDKIFKTSHVSWQVHTDLYFATCKLLADDKNIHYIDLSSLETTELTRYPESLERLHDKFLKQSKFVMQAFLPDILQKLMNGETILLSGDITPELYSVLTSLSLGLIEGKQFSGKLIIITSPKAAELVSTLTVDSVIPHENTLQDKVALLKRTLPQAMAASLDSFVENNPELSSVDYAKLENAFMQTQIIQQPLLTSAALLPLNDKQRSDEIDTKRLQMIDAVLDISPWVMIEGTTGIGKTEFLHKVLPEKNKFFHIEDWFMAKPAADENAILVIDEANFLSELGGLGNNFLNRFKSLNNTPPAFYWKGKFHTLTPQHKVIFAFNPAMYGAGRDNKGILEQHALSVKFNRLPDFYWRERIIKPLFNSVLLKQLPANLINELLPEIADPIISVYNWIMQKSGAADSLITPREIKLMVNLAASKILATGLHDKVIINRLASEIAYHIGNQAISEHSELRVEFDKHLKPEHFIIPMLTKTALPIHYQLYQESAYRQIEDLLQARQTILTSHAPDLGLGGIVLEGGSGIGKSTFINHIQADYKKQFSDKKVYRISPTTSYNKKVSILREAFAEGALVMADEINTSLWPNKLLNNLLMGMDANGKKAKHPGFFLIATQNPVAVDGQEKFKGRYAEDPAFRRRVIKLNLSWPRYETPKPAQPQPHSATLFAKQKRLPKISLQHSASKRSKPSR